jgi:hypothetical protein
MQYFFHEGCLQNKELSRHTILPLCVILGFRRETDENCPLLGFYEIVFVNSQHFSLRNCPEERSSASIYKSLIRKLYITNLKTIVKNTEHIDHGLACMRPRVSL